MSVHGPSARAPRTTSPAKSPAKSGEKRVAAPPKNRPTLPVTDTDKPERSFAAVTLHPDGHASAVLRLDDVLAAPEKRRETLLWRFAGNAALRAGLALGASQTRLPAAAAVSRRGVQLATDDGRTARITVDGETRAVDTHAPRADDVTFALRAFDRALLKNGEVDRDVAAFYLPLFGPDGAFVRGRRRALDERQVFARPKLFCWDFNGTVERFDDGRTRAALPGSAAALRRRGGMSVLTTSMRAEDPEQFLEKHRVPFVAHYGHKQVRPCEGNKHYAGVARAHGVDLDDARHVMATFGDSKTDAAADLPGVVFFHNDATTPAPALERVLAELDRRGNGSLHDGLVALVDGLPAPGEKKRASVGPISFAVEVRGDVPTIHDVAVVYTIDALVDTLRKMPPPAQLDQRALYRLALEHLADAFPQGDVPAVLDGLRGTPGLRAARAAVERRLAWRETALGNARAFLDKSERWSRKALSVDDMRRNLRDLVDLGDAEIAARARALARELVDIGPAAERELLASVAAHARHLRAHIKKAESAALPMLSGSGDLAALEKIARNPVPFDVDKQKKQLEAIDALLTDPQPGSAPMLKRILTALDENLPKERKQIRERFADRNKRADEILAAVDDADAVARRTPAELAAIARALEAPATP